MPDVRLDRYAVTFDADVWLTVAQMDGFQYSLLPLAQAGRLDDVTQVLIKAERTCLDTALLGMVIGYESGRWKNRLVWREAGPTAKVDAGVPDGLWLPPSEFNENAADTLASRLNAVGDHDRSVLWARQQLVDWWDLARFFERGAVIETVDLAGCPQGTSVPVPTGLGGVGRILSPEPEVEGGPGRCAAQWTIHVVSDWFHEDQQRRCVFPAEYGTDRCRVHRELGV